MEPSRKILKERGFQDNIPCFFSDFSQNPCYSSVRTHRQEHECSERILRAISYAFHSTVRFFFPVVVSVFLLSPRTNPPLASLSLL